MHWCINPRPLMPGADAAAVRKGPAVWPAGKRVGGGVTLTSSLSRNANTQAVGEQERSRVRALSPAGARLRKSAQEKQYCFISENISSDSCCGFRWGKLTGEADDMD